MQFPGNGLFFGRVDLEIFECLELLIIHFAGELGQERRWLHLCFLIMNLSSIPVPLDTNHPNGYCKGMPSHPKDMYSMNHYHLIEINFIFQLFSAVMMTINPATRFDLRPQTQPSPHLSAWTGALTMKGKAKTAKPIIHRRVELLDKNPRHGVPWRWCHKRNDLLFSLNPGSFPVFLLEHMWIWSTKKRQIHTTEGMSIYGSGS